MQSRTVRSLYNFFFDLFFVLSAPYYFFRLWKRGNWREGFSQRFGRYDTKLKQAVTNRHVIWFHAVSVGEVNICTQLIKALEARVPNIKIVVSTTTTTGMGELVKKLPGHINKIYYPIDRKRFVQRAFSALHPDAIVLVEAEIWPNFLWQARSRKIPVFLVNARLSEKSYRGYRRFGWLFRSLFEAFEGIGVQNIEDAERLRQLGCIPEVIHLIGNLKFDSAKIEEKRRVDVLALLRQIGVPEGSPILLGGSTHAGEEGLLADIFLRLKKSHPNLFLIVVPRHFERGKEVGRELEKRKIPFIYRSQITQNQIYQPRCFDCLLVNTTGELRFFYEHSTVVFVGKSISAKGGQSPIEPGALGKAMVFGPNMQNFAAIAAAFVRENGAIQVKSSEQLESAIHELLLDGQRREMLGKNALRVVHQNRGAIDRTIDMIVNGLKQEDMYLSQ